MKCDIIMTKSMADWFLNGINEAYGAVRVGWPAVNEWPIGQDLNVIAKSVRVVKWKLEEKSAIFYIARKGDNMVFWFFFLNWKNFVFDHETLRHLMYCFIFVESPSEKWKVFW